MPFTVKCLKLTLEAKIEDPEISCSVLNFILNSLCSAFDLNYTNNNTDDEYLYSVSVFIAVNDPLYSELQDVLKTYAKCHELEITNSEFAEIQPTPNVCIDQQFEKNQ